MLDRLHEGIFRDETWEVIDRTSSVSREVLWVPFNEKKGRVYLLNGDLFHPLLSLEDLDSILSVVASSPQHLFIAVTERPELSLARLYAVSGETPYRLLEEDDALNNLWFLVRMRNQEEADARMPAALALKNCWVADGVRCPMVGILADPLRGSIDLWEINGLRVAGFGSIDWIVCGGEAGGDSAARRAWVRELRDQAKAREIPFLFAGWGDGGRLLDGRAWDEVPPYRPEANRLHIFDRCRPNCGRDVCRAA